MLALKTGKYGRRSFSGLPETGNSPGNFCEFSECPESGRMKIPFGIAQIGKLSGTRSWPGSLFSE
jgi:glycyl-tRNA synthetase (class II)